MHACMFLHSTQLFIFPYTNTKSSIKIPFEFSGSLVELKDQRERTKMEAIQTWVSQHKLTTIGSVWASAIGASLAYSRSATPLKPSLRLIHARMHAQALTLAVLSGAAVYHYYEKRGANLEPSGNHN